MILLTERVLDAILYGRADYDNFIKLALLFGPVSRRARIFLLAMISLKVWPSRSQGYSLAVVTGCLCLPPELDLVGLTGMPIEERIRLLMHKYESSGK